jgi:zinc D-Ala-D-Ala carboxypeptidase
MPNKLTEHFTLEELVISQTAERKGIDNSPSAEIIKNLTRVASLLEEVRVLLGTVPILISSGYRSPDLNKAIGGSKKSAHMAGLAVDFTAPGYGSVLQVAKKIASSSVPFDQVIYEYGSWVHLGLSALGTEPRRQELTIFRGAGYLNGLISAPQ